ncbi:hypothetical protein ABZ541_23720 [Micromonospora sediminicola]|uniref:hypothetical protein n=1 Tax=Micromonospora sediminicola TaxID=946078 RepID=UPI0033D2C80E
MVDHVPRSAEHVGLGRDGVGGGIGDVLTSAAPTPRLPDAARAQRLQVQAAAFTREVVREILAEIAYADHPPDREWISSIEVAWLVAAVERRYRTRLTLNDEQTADIRTIDDAVRILTTALAAHGGVVERPALE